MTRIGGCHFGFDGSVHVHPFVSGKWIVLHQDEACALAAMTTHTVTVRLLSWRPQKVLSPLCVFIVANSLERGK